MKKTIFVLSMMLTLGAYADIDVAGDIVIEPKAARVEASRSCFNELAKLGCGHPRDDQEHFKACLSQVSESLDTNCKSMMKRLYGK